MTLRLRATFYHVLLFCSLVTALPAAATHIVGGEIEMSHQGGNTYQITLNIYFDLINGNPGAVDPSFQLAIFQKSNDQLKLSFIAPQSQQIDVNYTSVECAIGELQTTNYQYVTNVELSPALYADPGGYYIVAERCCRNGGISNIILPGETGQTFYLEFPALQQNGAQFVNSSPQLFPPLSDYACRGNYFYYDFAGTDPDGDSLVYSLAEPLRGYSTTTAPAPAPLPALGGYPTVTWAPGYSATEQITGPQNLSIDSQTGFLEMTPGLTGLFVFAIRCAEFRDGVQIGVVQREFQVLVIDCPVNEEPSAAAEVPGLPGLYNESDTIVITPQERCFNLLLSDPDTTTSLSVRVDPVGFDLNSPLLSITGGTVNTITNPSDTLNLQLCFDSCFAPVDTLLRMDVILADDGCSLPKTDTINVLFYVEAPLHPAPVAGTSLTGGDTIFVDPFETTSFTISGTDADGETVTITGFGDGFDAAGVGITFPNISGAGTVTAPFSWEPSCEQADSLFPLVFVATDDNCVPKRDTVRVWVRVGPLTASLPVASAVQGPNSVTGDTLFLVAGDLVAFDVQGFDPDSSQVSLRAFGTGFDLGEAGMEFFPASGQTTVNSLFQWQTFCAGYEQDIYQVNFVAEDVNCDVPGADTVTVWLELFVPPNNTPDIFTSLPGDTVVATIGEPLVFDVTGTDQDGDTVTVTGRNLGTSLAALGASFPGAQGDSVAVSPFSWTPTCDQFAGNQFYRLEFVVKDSVCVLPRRDTAFVWVRLVPPPNDAPTVSLPAGLPAVIRAQIGEPLTFPVTATDPNGDLLTLTGGGIAPGITFSSATGDSLVSSTFSWVPPCALVGPTPYTLTFFAQDDACQSSLRDSVSVRVLVEHENAAALVETDVSTFDPASGAYQLRLIAGRDTTFTVRGIDTDTSSLNLRAEGVGFDLTDYGMTFNEPAGQGRIEGTFTWTTDCAFLTDGNNPFLIRFVLEEFSCPASRFDTLLVSITVADLLAGEYEPMNVFTPNGDGKNDFFVLSWDTEALPPDNCDDAYEYTEIFDRWGRSVYRSEDRSLIWDGDDLPAGTYFYLIKFRRKVYKNWVQLLR